MERVDGVSYGLSLDPRVKPEDDGMLRVLAR